MSQLQGTSSIIGICFVSILRGWFPENIAGGTLFIIISVFLSKMSYRSMSIFCVPCKSDLSTLVIDNTRSAAMIAFMEEYCRPGLQSMITYSNGPF